MEIKQQIRRLIIYIYISAAILSNYCYKQTHARANSFRRLRADLQSPRRLASCILIQLQELRHFGKAQNGVMIRRKANETEIDQHRDRCVYTAVIAAADTSLSCTGRLSCVCVWVGFT